MKQFKLILGLCVFVLFANSCKDDFDLPADFKDIPIVYGILEVDEDNHYVRVERAFLGANLSPLVTAQNPDSLYYDDAVVEIENMTTGQFFQLDKVNAEDEGFTRKEGVFASSPNFIYKIRGSEMNLQGGESIRLRINRSDNQEVITSDSTVVLPPMTIAKPAMPIISRWDKGNKVDFAWKPESNDATIFDVELIFKYQEKVGNEPTVLKSVSWKPVRNKRRSAEEEEAIQLNERIAGDAFFQFVGNAIDETILARRIPVGLDYYVYAGGSEIQDFFDISLANTGVTGSQDPPVFSNISGGGRGIFSSKSTAILKNIQLQNEARDSLLFGRYTRDLRFE